MYKFIIYPSFTSRVHSAHKWRNCSILSDRLTYIIKHVWILPWKSTLLCTWIVEFIHNVETDCSSDCICINKLIWTEVHINVTTDINHHTTCGHNSKHVMGHPNSLNITLILAVLEIFIMGALAQEVKGTEVPSISLKLKEFADVYRFWP